MGVTSAEDEMLMQWGRDGVISDAQGQAILCALYKKRGLPTKDRILTILKSFTYLEHAKSTVKSLTDKGYKIALLSGSMDVLVEYVANDLGIELWACNNRFCFGDDGILEKIETIDNDDTFKINQLKLCCAKLGIDPRETMCVGDGDNDALLFDLSECGVTFEDSPIKYRAKYTINSLAKLPSLLL